MKTGPGISPGFAGRRGPHFRPHFAGFPEFSGFRRTGPETNRRHADSGRRGSDLGANSLRTYDSLGLSGNPGNPKFRRIPGIFAISKTSPRDGSLLYGFRAPGGRIRGIATGPPENSWPPAMNSRRGRRRGARAPATTFCHYPLPQSPSATPCHYLLPPAFWRQRARGGGRG